MATAGSSGRTEVRLNDLDWKILEVMADEKRYTPQHLYDDIFGDEGAGWTRQRVRHLASNGLVEQVGSSRMYIITTWGMAALDLRDTYDDEENPQDFIQRVIHHAESASESGESPNSTA